MLTDKFISIMKYKECLKNLRKSWDNSCIETDKGKEI